VEIRSSIEALEQRRFSEQTEDGWRVWRADGGWSLMKTSAKASLREFALSTFKVAIIVELVGLSGGIGSFERRRDLT